jgi:hypothetical protein
MFADRGPAIPAGFNYTPGSSLLEYIDSLKLSRLFFD